MANLLTKMAGKVRHKDKVSKGERLIYVVIFLWVAFGVLGILKGTNITQLAGYYASLTLFVSTYLWGEWKRTSAATKLFSKGENSSREVMIYITIFLWSVLGAVGIFFMTELNSLTVYFSSLSPFVISFIIYKTSKGEADLPIFNGDSKKLVDNAMGAVDINKTTVIKEETKKTDDTTTKTTTITSEKDKLVGAVSPEEPKDVIVDNPTPDNGKYV